MTTKSLAAWADSPGAHQLLAACLSLPLMPSGLLDIRHYNPLWWKEVTVTTAGVAWTSVEHKSPWTPWSREPTPLRKLVVFPEDLASLCRQRPGTQEFQVLRREQGGWRRETWLGDVQVGMTPLLMMSEQEAIKYSEAM